MYVAPDESYLIVASNREGGLDAGDLYIAFRQPDDAWGTLAHMGDVSNSERDDYCPMVSPDGGFFFFSRRDSAVPFTIEPPNKPMKLAIAGGGRSSSAHALGGP